MSVKVTNANSSAVQEPLPFQPSGVAQLLADIRVSRVWTDIEKLSKGLTLAAPASADMT